VGLYVYVVHLRLVGKPVVDFLLVIIVLHLLDVTAFTVLRANNDRKSPFLKGVGNFGQKFYVEDNVPANHLCTVIDRPVNALQLCR